MSLNETIYNLVKQIPPGEVTTYGMIARMANCTPRQVGWALASCEDESVPWHRVVNRFGKISPRGTGNEVQLQRSLLEKEGIRFDENGVIVSMKRTKTK